MFNFNASAPIYPIPQQNITYDPVDKSYTITGSYPSLREEESDMFYSNPSYVLFIALVEGEDEPQIQAAQAIEGSDVVFYTRADIEAKVHSVLFAVSNGILGSKTKPLWLTPISQTVYNYTTALTVKPIGEYLYKGERPANAHRVPTEDKLVLEMAEYLEMFNDDGIL